MNPQYSVSVPGVAKLLGSYGIEAGYVIPTGTALVKSIMDATWPLREYLSRTGVHVFEQQGQGREGKRVLPLRLITAAGIVETKVSLYRPGTKEGDPRIWIYGLQAHASEGDLIALLVDGGILYAFNCNRLNVPDQLVNPSTFLGDLAKRRDIYAPVSKELLGKLKEVAALGFLPSLRSGDTGVGYTLETHLGIRANCERAPDYKGIELKSGRLKRTGTKRHITLFSCIPDWRSSPFSAWNALETFGYKDQKTERLQLYCSIDAKQPNSLGFKLDPQLDVGRLANINTARTAKGEDVFYWLLDTLRKSFGAKHRETFWVSARTTKIKGLEHFHFVQARHTRNPQLSTFERLLSTGGICVDLTMSHKGNSAVRDHGYLFRVYGNHFDELFPEVALHSLV